MKPCVLCAKLYPERELSVTKLIGVLVFTCRQCDKETREKLGAETNPIEDSGFRVMKPEIKGKPSNLPLRRK